jgi:hypothetical protein
VPRFAARQDGTVEHIKGRKQCSGPVPLVVVGHPFGIAQPVVSKISADGYAPAR